MMSHLQPPLRLQDVVHEQTVIHEVILKYKKNQFSKTNFLKVKILIYKNYINDAELFSFT